MKVMQVLVAAGSILLSAASYSQAVSDEIGHSVITRCRDQMGSYGASLVKVCVDQDLEAYAALKNYEAEWQSVIDRCSNQMLSTGGWALVKVCTDQDIEAEKSLREDY